MMVSLSKVGRRFEVPLTVIEGGSGTIQGIISETDQQQIPSYIFVQQRHVLRVPAPTALQFGMVVRTPAGQVYILGDNGPSEAAEGTVWQSFRLFEPSGQYRWERRIKVVDPVTRLERDDGLQDMGTVWAAMEPLDREAFDRKIRASFEQSRFITGAAVLSDDLLDGRPVTKSDVLLGLRIGVIT
jgi:hypothetical protein